MKRFLVCAALGIASVITGLESDANACGGCFAPQENPTVVNDHRMILSISKDKSTLYDQIKYTGSPSSFAWVLPIAGTVDVGISSDLLFNVLDQQTQTRLLAPPQNCPPAPDNCLRGGSSGTGLAAPSAGADNEGSVQVLKEEVVGPYDTKQLAVVDPDGTPNPEVLNKWLADNGYAIPDDVKPVIAKYVEEKFNFFVMKLVPNANVKDMRPVSITSQGAGTQLPLRMVAAGTGPNVGIGLWVVSEGRYQPQNFESFIIDTNELVWDWTQQQSNYTELRAAKTAAGKGRIWEIESSTEVFKTSIQSIVKQGTYNGSGPFPTNDDERAAQDYLPDQNKNLTAAQVRDADLATLFYGMPAASVRVTRLRADLAHAALDQDLQMIASTDQAEIPLTRQILKEKNQPLCPVWDGCTTVGTAPRDEAIARSTPPASASGSSCAVAPPSGNVTFMAAGFGVFAVAVGQAFRRRRR
jgi:hypothetical protein